MPGRTCNGRLQPEFVVQLARQLRVHDGLSAESRRTRGVTRGRIDVVSAEFQAEFLTDRVTVQTLQSWESSARIRPAKGCDGGYSLGGVFRKGVGRFPARPFRKARRAGAHGFFVTWSLREGPLTKGPW